MKTPVDATPPTHMRVRPVNGAKVRIPGAIPKTFLPDVEDGVPVPINDQYWGRRLNDNSIRRVDLVTRDAATAEKKKP